MAAAFIAFGAINGQMFNAINTETGCGVCHFSLASGLIAGEAILAVVLALLAAAGAAGVQL
jgi:uncharacterized oligopeptide transporter (OPT) family protein